MKVLLIDVDSKIPNIALMKIAQYHKSIGDEVGFNITDPDKVYASVIFKKNRHNVDGLQFFYPNAEIDIGGSGYDITKKLPQIIEGQSPDYSIYPENDTYFGFTTRGCIRHCYFCIVHDKEGKFRKLYDDPEYAIKHITNNYQKKYTKIQFLDNNILANKQWFMRLTEELIHHGWKVDFNQGLDVRLLDREIADRLKQLKPITCWKFAFDDMSVKDDVLKGIQILQDAGIDTKHKVMFYCYCNGQEQVWDCVDRCRILKEHHTTPYVMMNRDTEQTDTMKKLCRWSRPWIVWSIDFSEYNRLKISDCSTTDGGEQ